jgi:glycosyltransferase involved in cell wall biosynthesis
MKIINIMLAKDLGGIQQAFVKYSQMLQQIGARVENIITKNAQIASQLTSYQTLNNWGQWDLFSIYSLRKILRTFKPDAIICHGSRAMIFAHFARQDKNCKLIGAAHNHNYKWLYKCDAVLSITQNLADFLTGKGIAKDNLYIIGNTLAISKPHELKNFKKPLVIGTLARLVQQKGIDIFLKAIAILRNKGYDFEVKIGGDGLEKKQLMKLATSLQLKNIEFIGWVADKESFFQQLDIFCSPSLYEPFGIVILEAMLHATPIVATKTQGPLENIINGQTGLLCNIGEPEDLADKLLQLAQNQELAQNLALNAYNYLLANFSQPVIKEKLNQCIVKICSM